MLKEYRVINLINEINGIINAILITIFLLIVCLIILLVEFFSIY